ncbi:hypothetical protein N658DRAFT_385912, partial [Parathielavia hyrcaniae]
GVPGAMLAPRRPEDAQILAAMDKLRELRIDQKYDLPQIIVCGAQSAGKSSVLESLVQVPFPRGDNNICTRYVTKVTMLQEDTPSIRVRIHPSSDRPEAEVKELSDLLWHEKNPEDYAVSLAAIMKKAHGHIFTGSAKEAMVTSDILQITVFGPDIRPLQVLDLPGLIEYVGKTSGNDGAPKLIKSMVKSHMAVKQSFILAVIEANRDLNNQGV